MGFEINEKVSVLNAKLEAFMAEHIYPREHDWATWTLNQDNLWQTPFGSMMSTPIINAPQSAILGMHNIVQRPVAINGEVQIRPMMYLALSYDHRIIDGRESVGFLVRVKQLLENPEWMVDGKKPEETLLGM